MFVFAAATVVEAIGWFHPETRAGLERIAEAWNTPRRAAVLDEVYPALRKISVDHGLMEPAARDARLHVCTVPMNVSWMDVGSWPAYAQTLAADERGNRGNAPAVHLDSRNVLAVSSDAGRGGHVIATIGCENLIIIHTPEATLICPADQAERVKEIAAMVEERLR
jgi:mannose-1-phosphate guanylyltransferase